MRTKRELSVDGSKLRFSLLAAVFLCFADGFETLGPTYNTHLPGDRSFVSPAIV